MSKASGSANTYMPGDFVYVERPGHGVQEARISAVGERYEVRLLANGETTTVSHTQLWQQPNF